MAAYFSHCMIANGSTACECFSFFIVKERTDVNYISEYTVCTAFFTMSFSMLSPSVCIIVVIFSFID